MKSLSGIKFKGSFRDYQQKILNNANQHLKDGHIHIVAAPGSGKTILGLELICRLGKPTLILSPSVTIKQQWGERFEESFIDKEKSNEYISYDLKTPSALTSITYQALHAAFTKKAIETENSEDDFAEETAEDFSDFDIMSVIKEAGIKTVCLDEAHHLQNEWQKALEEFLSKLDRDVKVIALTATPPYDGTKAEWDRYIAVCGEIDEEIFVPQLVAQKSLCPHQDFIYFNYPTEEEMQVLNIHREEAINTCSEILNSDFMKRAYDASGLSVSNADNDKIIMSNSNEFAAFFSALKFCGYPVNSSRTILAAGNGTESKFDLATAETAFQFIINNPDIFSEAISEELRAKLSSRSLIEQRKVCLTNTDKINRMLLSSSGKIASIRDIVKLEIQNLKDDLRMLILTDYIKKDLISCVGTDTPITTMGTVPIFEVIRRDYGNDTKIALLSGTLVIVPNISLNDICSIADAFGVSYTTKPIENTKHSIVNFTGSNKNKVTIITEAFKQGLINILIGTKSLLGEGWDSPCINSLILASFVGSFMLSNQMRGRAIRIDKNVPDKCANIWHLTTVEPPFEEESSAFKLNKKSMYDKILGNDFDTLKRRFDGFLAPSYNRDIIESGIDRIDILKAPFDEKGIADINLKMLETASDRINTTKRWNDILSHSVCDDIIQVDEIPPENLPKGLLKAAITKEVFIAIFTAIAFLLISLIHSKTVLVILCILASIVSLTLLIIGLAKIVKHSKPEKTVCAIAKSLLRALKETGQIESKKTNIVVNNVQGSKNIYCAISLATEHDKKIFSKALAEMLSPLNDPRYLLLKQSRFLFLKWVSYGKFVVCPSILANKKESATLLSKRLKGAIWKSMPAYIKGDKGTAILLRCKKDNKSPATENVQSKKIVNPGFKAK